MSKENQPITKKSRWGKSSTIVYLITFVIIAVGTFGFSLNTYLDKNTSNTQTSNLNAFNQKVDQIDSLDPLDDDDNPNSSASKNGQIITQDPVITDSSNLPNPGQTNWWILAVEIFSVLLLLPIIFFLIFKLISSIKEIRSK